MRRVGEKGTKRQLFGSQLPALRAEAALFGPAFLCSLGPWLDHGTIVRLMGVIIGKLGRDQRSGARDQKRNDLRRGWRGCLGGGGLTRKDRGQGSCVRGQKADSVASA
jgi:hypothetical protein